MKGDFTRDTFDASRHFTRVLMQQGRVLLDADWNEQAAILLNYLQALASDIIGPHGGPTDNLGFGVSVANDTAAGDFLIGAGVYYVDGARCENETRTKYAAQKDYPLLEADKFDPALSPYLVYLDVWERQITHLEGEGIREVALGGPDTAARARLVQQVKALPVNGTKDPVDLAQIDAHVPSYSAEQRRALIEISLPILIVAAKNATGTAKQELEEKVARMKEARALLDSARLRARAFAPQPSTDPCTISPDSRYRRATNQLYRVEVHRSGRAWDGDPTTPQNAATFKWSRENGSVIFSIERLGGNIATLANLGRDDRFGLREGDYVEIVDDDYLAQNRAGQLLTVDTIDRDNLRVTFAETPQSNVGQDPNKHPLLRRWDHNARVLKVNGGAALIIEGKGDDNWLNLEDGVQIQFAEPTDPKEPPHQYRTADYWLIPARTETGDVEWPGPPNAPDALPPRGVKHRYAPLHKVTINPDGKVEAVAANDLRLHFDAQATK